MVGCVVVKNGKVLAPAHRGEIEGNHAEFIALEKKLGDEALTGCTVYTTLEPCTTRKHPKIPCGDRLIERRVARVVYGMLDPDPRICGKGIRKLQSANIEVKWFPHELVMELEELNRHFTRSVGESGAAAGQAQAEKERIVKEKRKLYNLLRKINGIQCDFRFPPGQQDAIFNGQRILLINKDIESIRDVLVESLDLPEAQALVKLRIPAAPLGSVPWEWLEATCREHFLPVQRLFRELEAEVQAPAPAVSVSDKWVDLMYPVNHLAQRLGLGPDALAWCRESKVPGLVTQGLAEVVHEPDSAGQPHRLRIKTSPESLTLVRRIPPQP
jgi:pyrimidine deaminase RibD-like protein